MPLVVLESTDEFSAVSIGVCSLSVLLVILEFAHILGAFIFIVCQEIVRSPTVLLRVPVFTDIFVTTRIDCRSLSVIFVILEFADVYIAFRRFVCSKAIVITNRLISRARWQFAGIGLLGIGAIVISQETILRFG